MFNLMAKPLYIWIREIFEVQICCSIYIKTYCKNNKVDYPVYSDDSNPLGYRNKFDHDGEYLTLSVIGSQKI